MLVQCTHPSGFVHDASKIQCACIFCHNSLAKVNTKLLIYDYEICVNGLFYCRKIMCTYNRGVAWSALRARAVSVSGTGGGECESFEGFFFSSPFLGKIENETQFGKNNKLRKLLNIVHFKKEPGNVILSVAYGPLVIVTRIVSNYHCRVFPQQ